MTPPNCFRRCPRCCARCISGRLELALCIGGVRTGHLFREGKNHEYPGQSAAYAPLQQIDVHTDTRRHPRACQAQTRSSRGLQDWFVCDIDAIMFETVSERDRHLHRGSVSGTTRCDFRRSARRAPYGLNGDLGLRYQSVAGVSASGRSARTSSRNDVHRTLS